MKRLFPVALIWLLALVLPTGSLQAQDPDPAGEEKDPAEEYRVKAYSISFWGGLFSGGTYYEGQALESNTYLAEGSNPIFTFEGDPFTELELRPPDEHENDQGWGYTQPRKEIRSGTIFGGRVGMFLSEMFHIDLVFSVARSQAVTSMVHDFDEEYTQTHADSIDYRVEFADDPRWTDKGFRVYQGGINLMYDAKTVKFFGLSPFVGFGVGALINRFTALEDKTALFFQMTGGLSVNVTESLQIYAQANATTFSFAREELHYGRQVAYKSLRMGINWIIDVVPDS